MLLDCDLTVPPPSNPQPPTPPTPNPPKWLVKLLVDILHYVKFDILAQSQLKSCKVYYQVVPDI